MTDTIFNFWTYLLLPCWLWLAFVGIQENSYWQAVYLFALTLLVFHLHNRIAAINTVFNKKDRMDNQKRFSYVLRDATTFFATFILVISLFVTIYFMLKDGQYTKDFIPFSTLAALLLSAFLYIAVMIIWTWQHWKEYQKITAPIKQKMMLPLKKK